MDISFTAPPLLDRLKQMGIYALGTISESRLLAALIMKTVTIKIYILNGKIYSHHVYIYMVRYIWE